MNRKAPIGREEKIDMNLFHNTVSLNAFASQTATNAIVVGAL